MLDEFELVRKINKLEQRLDNLRYPRLSAAAVSPTYNPDSKPGAPSPYDDEFESTILNARWTAINCAAGTVDLLTTAAAADTHDLSTFAGLLALQPGRDDTGAGEEAEAAILRQTVVLAANCKIVIKLAAALSVPENGGFVASGVMLSTAAGFNANDFIFATLIPATNYDVNENSAILEAKYQAGGGGVIVASSLADVAPCYIMITKTGDWYSVFYSPNGAAWAAALYNNGVGFAADYSFEITEPLTRLSIFSYYPIAAVETGTFNPISTFDFVRYFTNNTPTCNA